MNSTKAHAGDRTRHAVGPWVYAPDWFAVRYYGDEGEFSHCMGIADVSDDLPDDSRHATGRLIAAAPELLEALDTLSLVVGLTAIKHESQRAALQEAFDKARAAIAKATIE